MPIAFFTRTQTGALISRMNNDVIGAQRAVTGTLGSVVSNVIVLVDNVVAMVAPRVAAPAVSLVLLPLFLLPAKRVGRRLQALTRERMDLNAVDEHHDDRALRRGRRAAGEAVRPAGASRRRSPARAGGVRDIGVRSAMYSRTFFIALGLVGPVGAAASTASAATW